MSSTYDIYSASNGNDGDLTTRAQNTHTMQKHPWWQIDFGSSKLVGAITFHNMDTVCASRLFDTYLCRWTWRAWRRVA